MSLSFFKVEPTVSRTYRKFNERPVSLAIAVEPEIQSEARISKSKTQDNNHIEKLGSSPN